MPYIPFPTTYGIFRNYCSSPTMSKLIQDRDQSTKTQCSAPSAPTKLTEGLSKIWRLPAPTKIAVRVVINPAIVYLSAKLVMREILVALSPGNVLNMALESIKLLCHLLQFMTSKSNPSCDNVCHLAAMFSGFVNPRGTSRARALSTRVWHCHLLSSPSVTSHPPLSPDNSPPCPTPPSLKSLLNQGLSLAEAKSSKEKCAKCSAALRSNTVLFQGIPSKM